MVNQQSAGDSVCRILDASHFNTESYSWGFSRLIPLARLADPAAGFLVGDRLRLKVELVC